MGTCVSIVKTKEIPEIKLEELPNQLSTNARTPIRLLDK
jgi:hypothetical protein